MAFVRHVPAVGLAATLGVHMLVLGLFVAGRVAVAPAIHPPRAEPPILWLAVAPAPEQATPKRAVRQPPPREVKPAAPAPQAAQPWVPQQPRMVPPGTAPASRAAPPAPTAEEWVFAGRYTLKNSKAYRHTWGQQVRSMMGTAVEGPDQGTVRFRVEIAPDGRLARLDTLWSTSPVAERLARKAIEAMPASPPTPTGQPLVFERTIMFSAFAHDDPPLYKDDCKPDPPEFSNPFAWDGRSPRPAPRVAAVPEPEDPQTLADCLKQLPKDSIEAEEAHDRRLLEQWASPKLGR
ncbi:MAG: energy transducer TonB [Rubrivivax sp.]|nr:energy transducer TonB [Rubrivivax sp.]